MFRMSKICKTLKFPLLDMHYLACIYVNQFIKIVTSVISTETFFLFIRGCWVAIIKQKF